jgi:hypothetical protein
MPCQTFLRALTVPTSVRSLKSGISEKYWSGPPAGGVLLPQGNTVTLFHNRKRGTSRQRRLHSHLDCLRVETIFQTRCRTSFASDLRPISEFDLQPLAVKLDCHAAKIPDERPMP